MVASGECQGESFLLSSAISSHIFLRFVKEFGAFPLLFLFSVRLLFETFAILDSTKTLPLAVRFLDSADLVSVSSEGTKL